MSQGHHRSAADSPAKIPGPCLARCLPAGRRMRYCLPAVFVLFTAAVAHAEPGGQNTPPPVQTPRRSPDFLFGRPDGSIAVRGSWIFSRGGSDWYDFVTDQLTIDRGAFNAPAVTFEVGFL